MIRKIWHKWDKFEEYTLVFILILMVILVFVQIIMRYVFQNSLYWSEELSRYLFLWLIWIGTSFALREHRHISLKIFANIFSKKILIYIEFFSLLFWFVFCFLMAYKGIELALILFYRGQTSPALGIPMAYVYLSMPIGFTLMFVRLIKEIAKAYTLLKDSGGIV